MKGRRVRCSPAMAQQGRGDGAWTPKGRGPGPGRAARRQGWSWGPGPVSHSRRQPPGLGVAGLRPPPCPPGCPGASPRDQRWERGCCPLAPSPGSQTAQQGAHRTHGTSGNTSSPTILPLQAFPTAHAL